MDYNSELYTYNEYGNVVDNSNAMVQYSGIPDGHVHDELGRLLKPAHEIPNEDYPEDYETLVSCWQKQKLSSSLDWPWTSKVAWPDLSHTVLLKRLDIFESDTPYLQQATTSIEASRRIRNTNGWLPVRSIYFLDQPTPLTTNLLVETTGPPKRNKYRLEGKENQRDFSTWVKQEVMYAYIGADRIPGTCDLYSDFCDLPDRYFLSSDPEPPIGSRRLYRFAAYTATQYFILEKRVFSEQLSAEGGYGMTYTIERGPLLTGLHGWRLIGSFFGFDHQLTGSSKYTIYRRADPFPRMLVALDNIQRPEEWDASLSFYAFDIPVPGTILYTLQHCLRSIHSAEASIPRHRLTTEHPKNPWEFRMNVYVFPAALEDCTCIQTLPDVYY
jgi:hypothetical protein